MFVLLEVPAGAISSIGFAGERCSVAATAISVSTLLDPQNPARGRRINQSKPTGIQS